MTVPPFGESPRLLAVILTVMALGGAQLGCASAPALRPVGPPMATSAFEGGAAVHGMVGQNVAGGGTTFWAQGQVAKDIILVGRATGSTFVPYATGAGGGDFQLGANGGFRGIYRVSDELFIGGEFTLDYLQFQASTPRASQYFISGVASFPVAEQAFLPGLWFYVQPTLGAGYRFGDVDTPFAGFTEVPLGVAYQWNELVVVSAEGGFAIPYNGGYLALGAAFRL